MGTIYSMSNLPTEEQREFFEGMFMSESRCTTDSKPVTEEELAEWEDWAQVAESIDARDRKILRLIAAVRAARAAEEYWHNQAYLMEGKAGDMEKELREARVAFNEASKAYAHEKEAVAKLAEIRAVVEKGLKYDWTNLEACLLRYQQYVERLEDVIGE